MEATINQGDYVLFPPTSEKWKELYKTGRIFTYHSQTLARILNLPSSEPKSEADWTWAFEDHAEVIAANLSEVNQLHFLRLLNRIGETASFSALFSDLEMRDFKRYRLGGSGNGNQDWLLKWHIDPLNQMQTQLPQIAIEGRKEFIRDIPALPPSSLKIRYAQQIVHLSRPIPSMPGSIDPIMEIWMKQKGSMESLFEFIDDLPLNCINKHGQDSLRVAGENAGTESNVFCRCVSLEYPAKRRIKEEGFYGANIRFNMALSSPVVLNLKKGDVLFISESFTYQGIKFPVIYDLAVYFVTKWLEDKGVIVLFSAGGSKTVGQNIDTLLNDLARQYQVANLPGIIVGGVDSTGRQFQSNYGNAVTCYASPPASQPDFDESSGATAVIAGMAVRAQNYARTRRKQFLTPAELKAIFRFNGRQVAVETSKTTFFAASLPNWELVRQAIDQLIPV